MLGSSGVKSAARPSRKFETVTPYSKLKCWTLAPCEREWIEFYFNIQCGNRGGNHASMSSTLPHSTTGRPLAHAKLIVSPDCELLQSRLSILPILLKIPLTFRGSWWFSEEHLQIDTIAILVLHSKTDYSYRHDLNFWATFKTWRSLLRLNAWMPGSKGSNSKTVVDRCGSESTSISLMRTAVTL